MNRKPQCFKCGYTPKYQQDYFKLRWCDRDLMTYFNWLDYNDMTDDPDHYLNDIKVANFDIINHECWGTPLQKYYKDYKTVEKDDLKEYPEQDKKKNFFLLPVVAVKKICE